MAGLQSVDFEKLYDLVVGFHPLAKPAEEKSPPPRCATEGFFAEETPSAKKTKRFALFERFVRVREDLMEKLGKLAEEGKKKFCNILARKRGSYKVAGDQSLERPPKINPSFCRLGNPVSSKASVWLSLDDVGKVESSIAALVEAQSFPVDAGSVPLLHH